MVMKQTNGLYPAPLKIMDVCVGGEGCVCVCDTKVCWWEGREGGVVV